MVDTELEAYTTRFIPSSGRNFTGLCLVLANLVEMVPLQVRWMPTSAQRLLNLFNICQMSFHVSLAIVPSLLPPFWRAFHARRHGIGQQRCCSYVASGILLKSGCGHAFLEWNQLLQLRRYALWVQEGMHRHNDNSKQLGWTANLFIHSLSSLSLAFRVHIFGFTPQSSLPFSHGTDQGAGTSGPLPVPR